MLQRCVAGALLLGGAIALVGMLGCAKPIVARDPGGKATITASDVAPAEKPVPDVSAAESSALASARTLSKAIAAKDEVAYAPVWDNGAVVGSLYEPFIAAVMKNSPGFRRLAAGQGRGDDVEGLLRELMPKEKFITITKFNAGEWAKDTLDLTGAAVAGNADEARVTAKTGAGVGIVLVMQRQSGEWKTIDIEGPFRDLFVTHMGKGFESVMPK